MTIRNRFVTKPGKLVIMYRVFTALQRQTNSNSPITTFFRLFAVFSTRFIQCVFTSPPAAIERNRRGLREDFEKIQFRPIRPSIAGGSLFSQRNTGPSIPHHQMLPSFTPLDVIHQGQGGGSRLPHSSFPIRTSQLKSCFFTHLRSQIGGGIQQLCNF